MAVMHKNQTVIHHNSPSCRVVEYPLPDADINGAVAHLSGRYPEQGWVVNTVSKEMGYVLSGSGKIVIEGVVSTLAEGDLVIIEPGKKYYWEGNLSVFLPCTPAWTPEQHKKID